MRSRLPLLRSAVAGFAAAVLLTACGGSGDEGSAAAPTATATSTSSASPSASPGTAEAPAADSDFCTEAGAVLDELNTVFTGVTDPAVATQGLQDAVERLRGLEAPEEIAADWTTLADGLEEFATAFGAVDQTDPESLARFEQTSQDLQNRLLPAATSVQGYLTQQCGLHAPAATPTAG